jgi:hypothetical protein
VSDADIRDRGAILLWHISDNSGAPPPAIKSRFPDLVVEVPRSFERPIQGRLPLYRVGWAMIRPQAAVPAPTGSPIERNGIRLGRFRSAGLRANCGRNKHAQW